jgi:hypothetical protein
MSPELADFLARNPVSTEDLFEQYVSRGTKRYEHPESDWEPHEYKTPKRPKSDDPIADRLLATREAIGSVPGELAGILSLAAYSPAGALFGKQPLMDYFSDLETKSNEAFMSNPGFFKEDRQVYPNTGDEDFAYWAAQIGLDPFWLATKPGRTALSAARFKPKSPVSRGARDLINPARRKFMQDTAVTAGVAGTGGIWGLHALTKSAPEAAAKAADNIAGTSIRQAAKVADDVAKKTKNSLYDDEYEALHRYLNGRFEENSGNIQLDALGDIDDALKEARREFDFTGDPDWLHAIQQDLKYAVSDLNEGRRIKNEAIDELLHSIYPGKPPKGYIPRTLTDTGLDANRLVERVLNDPDLFEDFWSKTKAKDLQDYMHLVIDDSRRDTAYRLSELKKFEQYGFIKIKPTKSNEFPNWEFKNLTADEFHKAYKKMYEPEMKQMEGEFPKFEEWKKSDMENYRGFILELIDPKDIELTKQMREYLRELDPNTVRQYKYLNPD